MSIFRKLGRRGPPPDKDTELRATRQESLDMSEDTCIRLLALVESVAAELKERIQTIRDANAEIHETLQPGFEIPEEEL